MLSGYVGFVAQGGRPVRRVSAAWLVWLAAALAAVSVGLAAAPLPGRFAGDSGLPPPEPVRREDAAEARVSLDAILALSPFGRIAQPAEPAPEAQETELGLTLHGVVIATRPEASSAIVSGPSEPARSYTVGQAVAGRRDPGGGGARPRGARRRQSPRDPVLSRDAGRRAGRRRRGCDRRWGAERRCGPERQCGAG